jgi:hypothetical protein
MANIVPVTKIITEENKNSKELNPNKNALLGKFYIDYRCKLVLELK